ncbi:MAG: cytochrome c biogenesis protein ResB [Planctomycetes bacterium]|nr:cytochrome c biogenesis protein ResB [Planctomycetota bacterium]
MNKFKKIVIHASLWTIICLIFLSIYGAFVGAERARAFFNSLPLGVFWIVFAVLLITGFMAFRRLIRHRSLLLIHLGCVLILAGALYGSETGHKLQKRFFGIQKTHSARMIIYEGQQNDRLYLKREDRFEQLPFSIKLDDFRMTYYRPGTLFVRTEDDERWSVPADVGNAIHLNDELGELTIIAAFENCKIRIDDGNVTAIEDAGPGSNPALAIRIDKPDGTAETKYIFEKFPGFVHSQNNLYMSYSRMVSDYISDLKVIADGKVVAEKSIEVNKPLYYGRYHFYQSSYDDEEGLYTILSVTSDTGLYLVYAGYLMLSIGVFWHFWLRKAFKITKPSGAADGN